VLHHRAPLAQVGPKIPDHGVKIARVDDADALVPGREPGAEEREKYVVPFGEPVVEGAEVVPCGDLQARDSEIDRQ